MTLVSLRLVNFFRKLPVNSKILRDKFKQLIKWGHQIACGMAFLHSKQVLHLDLAARNVFLSSDLQCKVGDFGFSQILKSRFNYVKLGEEVSGPELVNA